MQSTRTGPLRLKLSLLLLACVLVTACKRPPTRTVAPVVQAAPKPKPARPPEVPLFAPRVQSTLALDGELAESAWREAAHSGGFRDAVTGLLGVPHSELRIANDGQRLLLGLYAADENIVATAKPTEPATADDDVFQVHIHRADDGTAYELQVAASGALREQLPAVEGKVAKRQATCAIEMDGTINDAKDDDEEWVAECILPFATLGLRVGDTLVVAVTRCDTPKGVNRRCATWKSRVQLQ